MKNLIVLDYLSFVNLSEMYETRAALANEPM